MQTITIDIINKNALRLLQDMELLQLIRLHKLKKSELTEKVKMNPSDFRGTITKETAAEMNKYVEQSRKEWSKNI